jgi:hypothetical protein
MYIIFSVNYKGVQPSLYKRIYRLEHNPVSVALRNEEYSPWIGCCSSPSYD